MNTTAEFDLFNISKILNNFSITSKTYPAVNAADQDIFNILEIKKYGACVAGGAALRWYQNYSVGSNDIDLYFDCLENFQKCHYEFLQKFVVKFSSKNAVSFLVSNKNSVTYKVQLIRNYFDKDPQKIIDNFDISVCKIATDGYSWFMGDNFSYDLKNKILRFEKVTPHILKRYIKYQTYGFEPIQSLSDLVALSPEPIVWNFESAEPDEDYDAI